MREMSGDILPPPAWGGRGENTAGDKARINKDTLQQLKVKKTAVTKKLLEYGKLVEYGTLKDKVYH